MTTTAFEFIHEGEAYNGSPLWRVETPAGENLGYVARSDGKRGTTWYANTPLTLTSVPGFQNREKAAEYLARVAEESR